MNTKKSESLYDRINCWIVSDDTGTSSKTIWSVMMGVYPVYDGIPADLDDFGRCYRLLELIPEWKERLPEVSKRYPNWKPIVSNWDKILKEFLKPRPSIYIISDIITK